jgi:hypothetical protein
MIHGDSQPLPFCSSVPSAAFLPPRTHIPLLVPHSIPCSTFLYISVPFAPSSHTLKVFSFFASFLSALSDYKLHEDRDWPFMFSDGTSVPRLALRI